MREFTLNKPMIYKTGIVDLFVSIRGLFPRKIQTSEDVKE